VTLTVLWSCSRDLCAGRDKSIPHAFPDILNRRNCAYRSLIHVRYICTASFWAWMPPGREMRPGVEILKKSVAPSFLHIILHLRAIFDYIDV
jgi:hypothetical protein